MATMKDIANLVGVSLTTVSNVVHGNYDRVSPRTVQRILDAIEQLHYVPNMSARALVSHSSRIIAFVDTHSPQETYAGNGFAGVLLSGLEGVVTDHGYFLMMRRGTNEDVLRLMLNNWNPDGVIFKDRVPQSLVDFVKKQGKPCVTINTYLDDPELIQVRAEDRRGGYLAALAVLLVLLSAGLPLWLWGSFAPLAAAAGYGLAVWYGYRNLDGMSGDISGFALTLGELCGCAAAILWR